MIKRPSPALYALTASALAALGSAGRLHAQSLPGDESTRIDYRYSAYREDALPAAKLSGPSGERYKIDTHQFRLAGLGLGDYAVTADLITEVMSGASPWFVQPVEGQAVQVMSGASIREERTDLTVGLTRKAGRRSATATLGYSVEDDYHAAHGSLQGDWALDDTVTTLSVGIGHSSDRLQPTQGEVPVGVDQARRRASTVFAGYSRILDARTVVQTTGSFTFHDGYLSDPYKQAWIESRSETVQDRRPDQRRQFSWLTRLRHFFKGADAALHADYRYYLDSWSVQSHALDVAWHQRLAPGIGLVPGVRFYSQSQADFYRAFYADVRQDGLAASDYRLSGYGAVSLSLAANAEISGWGVSLRFEDYTSGARYSLGSVDVENPGLVDFKIVSIGLKKSF